MLSVTVGDTVGFRQADAYSVSLVDQPGLPLGWESKPMRRGTVNAVNTVVGATLVAVDCSGDLFEVPIGKLRKG